MISSLGGTCAGDPAGRRERTLTLMHLARALALSDEAAHDACQLLDRLTHRGLSSSDARSPAVLAAALLIAAEQGAESPVIVVMGPVLMYSFCSAVLAAGDHRARCDLLVMQVQLV